MKLIQDAPSEAFNVPLKVEDIGIPVLFGKANQSTILRVTLMGGNVTGFVEYVEDRPGNVRCTPGFFLTRHTDDEHVCNTISHETIHQVLTEQVSINASMKFDNLRIAQWCEGGETYAYFAVPPDQSGHQGEEAAEGLNRGADILSCVGGKSMPTKIVAKKDKTTKQKVRFVQTFENGISVTMYVPKDEKKTAALKEITGSLNFE